jgi:glycosyltransferase involved in cell wall biosynthesis
MILLSVVIPTHNRADRLQQNVLALTRQTAPADTYEIVVVADGCTDGTEEMIASLATVVPCRLRVVAQQSSGPAAARNLGAAAASGAILLFLDDDMEASAGLVAAHIAAHQEKKRAIVLGRFWTPPDPAAGLLSNDARRWWADCAAARAMPDHRFTYLDVCTGNLSISKDFFAEVGGFDARIGPDMAGEDFDIGIRLVRAGGHFVNAGDAGSIHHDRPNRRRAFQRAEQEGRGQALLTQRYPEVFWQFAIRHLGELTGWPAIDLVSGLLWSLPGLARPLVRLLVVGVAAAEAIGRPHLARRLHGIVHRYHYFLGARSVLGTREAWERLQQDAPLEPADGREIELNLAVDFNQLDTVMAAAGADAVRVSHRNSPILRIEPVFGAEPLRGVHVRRALLRRTPGLVLGLLLEDRGARLAEE